MAFVSLANLSVIVQLSLLLCSSFVVYGYRTLGEYELATSPQSPGPVSPPAKPPSHPKPAKPPSYAFPRRRVVVHGVVRCMFCYDGGFAFYFSYNFLAGAVVKLQCNNTKHSWEEQTTSDEGGRFNFTPGGEKLSTFGVHKCEVLLVSSPDQRCPLIDDVLGISSASLSPDPNPPPNNSSDTVGFFTVGRLQSAPPKPYCS